MRKLFPQKLKGSSLVEVIVAMLIASIVFAFTFTIISNVSVHSGLLSRAYYDTMAYSVLEKMRRYPSDFRHEKVVETEHVFVHSTILSYPEDGRLEILEVRIVDGNGKEKAIYRCLNRSQ